MTRHQVLGNIGRTPGGAVRRAWIQFPKAGPRERLGFRRDTATWGRGDRFRPTARYSAATAARGFAQLTGNCGGIPGYR